MSEVIVPLQVDERIRRKFSAQDVKAYENAVQKLREATLQNRQRLLTGVKSDRFRQVNVRWTMRSSKKYRLLIGQEQGALVVRGLVSRGDHNFYPKE